MPYVIILHVHICAYHVFVHVHIHYVYRTYICVTSHQGEQGGIIHFPVYEFTDFQNDKVVMGYAFTDDTWLVLSQSG